jgi:hypothetical protein
VRNAGSAISVLVFYLLTALLIAQACGRGGNGIFTAFFRASVPSSLVGSHAASALERSQRCRTPSPKATIVPKTICDLNWPSVLNCGDLLALAVPGQRSSPNPAGLGSHHRLALLA